MIRKLLAAMSVFPLMAACAPFASALPPSPQSAMLEATCSKVMRLTPGQAQFDGCVESLNDSFSLQAGNLAAARLYRQCLQTGLKPGTVELSRCMLDRGATAPGTPASFDAAFVKPADDNPDSYFSASFRVRRRREEYACAQLGLVPGSGPFGSCVAKLDSDLFNIDHPPE